MWTLTLFDDLSARLGLQWMFGQRFRASVSSGIDFEEAFKGKLSLFPFTVSFDVDAGEVEDVGMEEGSEEPAEEKRESWAENKSF